MAGRFLDVWADREIRWYGPGLFIQFNGFIVERAAGGVRYRHDLYI
jgi:hypothetical protein